jgi:hypothetical protein
MWQKGAMRAPRPMRQFFNTQLAPMDTRSRELDAALEHAIDVDRDVAPAQQFAAHVDARRVASVTPAVHQAFGDIALVHALQFGQLQLAVHALGFPGGIGMRGRHRHALADSPGDDVGQVVLALRVALPSAGSQRASAAVGATRMPVLISVMARSASSASFSSTMRLTRPLTRTMRP